MHDLAVLTAGRVATGEDRPQNAVTREDRDAPEAGAMAVGAPMDGSVWFRPKPGADAFIPVGGAVEVGDTVGLIEIMKTFSPIRAQHSGVWLGPALGDGDAVEAGSVIGWLRPS